MRLNQLFRSWWYIVKYQHILRTARFGRGCRITGRLAISGPGKVTFGDRCMIEDGIWGGEYTEINTHHIDSRVVIGANVLLRGTKIGCYQSVAIGDGTRAEHCFLMDSDFHNVNAQHRHLDFHHNDRPIVIEQNCYLGYNSVCCKGTVLKAGAVVLAASLLNNKTIAPGQTVLGCPARPVAGLT